MFRQARQGAIRILATSSPINGECVEELSKLIEACISEGQPQIVLEMQEVPLLDSQGLELLLAASDQVTQRGGALKLAGPTRLCHDILNATGIAEQLEIHPETRQAVGSFLQ